MEILKGKVQDPGFPDTEITYLKTDDGKTYFFIENGTLKNGNYIATPNLKEGIGHAPYTSLGLIDKEGNVLIPFENKNIQSLSNELLLVERNNPTTDTVISALEKQKDPLSASELVESANTIKSQITSVMGSNGTFVFDNQFSEAALYTTDGVNLGNNYFSFIGAKDGAYFMSSNVVGSPIAKYDPYAFAMENENQQENNETNNVEQNANEENNLKTQQTDEIVPNANEQETLPNQEENQEVSIPQEDMEITNPEQPNTDIPLTPELPQNDALTPDIPVTEVDENVKEQEIVDNSQEINEQSQTGEMGKIDIPSFSDEIVPPNVEEQQETTIEENNEISEMSEDVSPPELNISLDEDSKEVSEQDIATEAESVEDNQESDELENDDSTSEGGEVEEEIQDEKSEDEKYYEENLDNPIIASATDTIKKLLDENRKQRQQLDQQDSDLYTLKTNNEILQEDNNSKSQEISSLRKMHETDRKNNIDLLRENNKLKAANQRQDEIIETLKQQNAALKEQVAGISALNSAVMEANTLFGSSTDDDYGYLGENDGHQYQKTA